MTKLGAQSASVAAAVHLANQPKYLGDPAVVRRMFAYLANDTVGHGHGPDILAQCDDNRLQQHCLEFTRALLGQDPDYVAMPNWNKAGVIDEYVARTIPVAATDPVERIRTALMLFVGDLRAVIDYAAQPGVEEWQWSWQPEALLQDYTKILLGIPHLVSED